MPRKHKQSHNGGVIEQEQSDRLIQVKEDKGRDPEKIFPHLPYAKRIHSVCGNQESQSSGSPFKIRLVFRQFPGSDTDYHSPMDAQVKRQKHKIPIAAQHMNGPGDICASDVERSKNIP